MSGPGPEQGRRLLDEALRLLDLAQATRPAGARADGDAHAGPECRICPLCRGIAHLREVDPAAVERLTGAVADVASAARDLLGVARPEPGAAADAGHGARGTDGSGGVPRVRIQRIDVTD